MLFLFFLTLACYGTDSSTSNQITKDSFDKVFGAHCIASNQRAACELLKAKKLQEPYSPEQIVLIEMLFQSTMTQLKSHQMRKQIAETIINYFFPDNEHTNYPALNLMYSIAIDDLKSRDEFECIQYQLKPIFIYAMNEINNTNEGDKNNRYKLFGLWLLDELLSYHAIANNQYLCFNLWSVGTLHLDFIESFLERRIKITHDSIKFEIIKLILADAFDKEFADDGKLHLFRDYKSEISDLNTVVLVATTLGKEKSSQQIKKLKNILGFLSGDLDKNVVMKNNPLTPTLKLIRARSRLLKHSENTTTSVTNNSICAGCSVTKKLTCCNVM